MSARPAERFCNEKGRRQKHYAFARHAWRVELLKIRNYSATPHLPMIGSLAYECIANRPAYGHTGTAKQLQFLEMGNYVVLAE